MHHYRVRADCSLERAHPHTHVSRRGVEEQRCGRKWCAPAPQPRTARVSRRRHRARAEIPRNCERIAIDPRNALLRFRQPKTIRYELLRAHVELADLDGIRTTARETDQADIVIRRQTRRAAECPRHILALRECIDVQHRLPRRLAAAQIRLPRRAPPDAAWLRRVLPEVVQLIAEDARECDAIVRIEDLHGAAEDRIVHGAAAQLRDRRRVLRLHPLQRPFAFDLFQPDERVRLLCGRRHGGHGGCYDGDFAHATHFHLALPVTGCCGPTRCAPADADVKPPAPRHNCAAALGSQKKRARAGHKLPTGNVRKTMPVAGQSQRLRGALPSEPDRGSTRTIVALQTAELARTCEPRAEPDAPLERPEEHPCS